MSLTEQKIEVLTKLRNRVAMRGSQDGHGHLCPLLSEIARDFPALNPACMELRMYVGSQLTGGITLETWQARNGFLISNRNHVQDRILWIDWMLGSLLHE